jgi:hypothetical protein
MRFYGISPFTRLMTMIVQERPAGRTLIVQERQSFSHMANGHSAGVARPQPLANVCKRDLQIPEIGYQMRDIKSGPAVSGRPYQLPLLSTSTTGTVIDPFRSK